MHVLIHAEWDNGLHELIACSRNRAKLEAHAEKIAEPSRAWEKAYEEWRERGVKTVTEFVYANKKAIRKYYRGCSEADACQHVINNFYYFDGTEVRGNLLEPLINVKKLKTPIPVIGQEPESPTPYYMPGNLVIQEVKEI